MLMDWLISRLVFNARHIDDRTLLKGKEWIEHYEGQLIMRRINDQYRSLRNGDLLVDGEFTLKTGKKMIELFGDPLSIRFKTASKENIGTALRELERRSCYKVQQHGVAFLGVFSHPLTTLKSVLKQQNTSTLFSNLFYNIEYMKTIKNYLLCKPKGTVYHRRDFIEFVYPLQNLNVLSTYLSNPPPQEETNQVLFLRDKPSITFHPHKVDALGACARALSYSGIVD